MISRSSIWAAALSGLLCLLTPALAGAAVRHAAPSGSGTECSAAAPCDIQTAVEAPAVVDGDEVVLHGGTYVTGSDPLVAGDAILIHSAAGGPRAVIDSSIGFAFVLADPGATAENLESRLSTGGAAIILTAGTTARRVTALASASGATGCHSVPSATDPPLIQNSACIATGSGGNGFNSSAGVTAGTTALALLRNVTAIGTGPGSTGVRSGSSGSGGAVRVDALNVIAGGTAGDVAAVGGAGSAAVAELSFSAFDSQLEGAGGSVSDPGSDSNITAPALLVNPASGDVHQRAGSWTIDRGSGETGGADLDGEPRFQGAAPDIGADELTVLRSGRKCSGQTATIVAARPGEIRGTAGRDVIIGSGGRDAIDSGAGNDLVCSLGGRDTIRAGDGDDRVRAAGAGDRLYGEKGRDRLLGGAGRDRLRGGPGKDLLVGQAGADRLAGGKGSDRCGAGSSKDRAFGCE